MAAPPPSPSSASASGQASPVVWETHISSLIQRDSRWRPLWSTMLKACTIPDAAVSYPGHASQRGTKPGRAHREELARCRQEPHPFVDGLSELRQRVFGRVGGGVGRRRARGSSSASISSLSSSSSATVPSTPPGSDFGGEDGDARWVLQKGRFVRRPAAAQQEAAGHYGEEAYIRELLVTILQPEQGPKATGGSGKGGGSAAAVQPRHFTYYPPNGFRAWEKGSFEPADSWRLAIVHSIQGRGGQFRFRHPTTGQVHALPAADGTVRLFRAGGGLLPTGSSSNTPHGPVWHSTTAEDSHLWSLEFQLGPDAGRTLRDCLRPAAAPFANAPAAPSSPPSAAALRPPRPTTPLAVALLFGHRRHPLPHETRAKPTHSSAGQSQIPSTDEQQRPNNDNEDPWAAALTLDGAGGSGSGSRPTSASKRGSRGRKASLDPFTGRWVDEEGKACGVGEEDSSYYHSVRDGASSLASCSSVGSWDGSERDGVNCWVRTGELSSSGGEEGEGGDADSCFQDVGLEGEGVLGA